MTKSEKAPEVLLDSLPAASLNPASVAWADAVNDYLLKTALFLQDIHSKLEEVEETANLAVRRSEVDRTERHRERVGSHNQIAERIRSLIVAELNVDQAIYRACQNWNGGDNAQHVENYARACAKNILNDMCPEPGTGAELKASSEETDTERRGNFGDHIGLSWINGRWRFTNVVGDDPEKLHERMKEMWPGTPFRVSNFTGESYRNKPATRFDVESAPFQV